MVQNNCPGHYLFTSQTYLVIKSSLQYIKLIVRHVYLEFLLMVALHYISSNFSYPIHLIVSKGPSLENNEVVGFDEEAKKVIERLVEGSECLDVIPVVGMPGLGKTTLARKIYHDPKIPDEFFYCIWVFVGQSYIKKDILFNILKGFTKRIEEFQDMDETEIAEEICDSVDKSGGKCLIVLADVWDSDIVDFVKTVFPENNRGHRIMATTRYIHVATAVNADPHNLKFLTQKESFQLLEKRAFGKSRCPVELKEHEEGIVEKCSGVPLTIVVIAGALRGRTNDSDWRVVKENVGKYLIEKDEHQRCLKIVGLSYNHLPQDRKACFLHFGAFPQGFDIPAWKLIRLWIAEGLIMANLPGSEIEEIAECHLNDFANRNLVMVMEKRCNGQIKTCRVHDMLHEFCVKEATRLCLIQQLECLEVLKLKEDAFTGKSWKVETGGFRKLRVLQIENAKFETWEASNCPFPRLRNLILVSCVDLKAVPLELADLEYLQEMTLDNTKKANESAKEIECKKQEKQTPESVKFKLTIPY
uniref:Late blight resistance protein homolog R1A-10 n=1 Tax=Nicotiana tabacum TaxID=4097 RepID=A0A1S4DJQ2_TOBAC|nr:PREDICTED: putative late blight resistance protein homolog R1A-10 [Nicotiana tabacum]